MTEPVYTTATIFTYNVIRETVRDLFYELQTHHMDMLLNSAVHSNQHPVYVRHWVHAEDAKAWHDLVVELTTTHSIEVKAEIAVI
jgi:hypothetical protein